MASLSGQSINTTYEGLLKTNDNGVLPTGFTNVPVTDGAGNATGLRLGQDYIGIEPVNGHLYDVGAENGFTFGASGLAAQGSWDFSGASVTGLPAGGGATEFNGPGGMLQYTPWWPTAAPTYPSQIYKMFGSLANSVISTNGISTNWQYFQPFRAYAGYEIDALAWVVRTAASTTDGLMIGIYDAVITTASGKTSIKPGNLLVNFNTESVPNNTTGLKEVTGLGVTLPASTVPGHYFLSFIPLSGFTIAAATSIGTGFIYANANLGFQPYGLTSYILPETSFRNDPWSTKNPDQYSASSQPQILHY